MSSSDAMAKDEDLRPVLDRGLEVELKVLVELLKKRRRCKLAPESRNAADIAVALKGMSQYYLTWALGFESYSYMDIAKKVARKLGATHRPDAKITEIEDAIMTRVLDDVDKKLSPEEREELFGTLEKELNQRFTTKALSVILKQVGVQAVRAIVYRIIAVYILRQAGVEGAALLVGAATGGALLGPLGAVIGAVIGAVWLAWDLSGPSYTVLIPAVVLVAAMRVRQQAEDTATEMRATA